MSNRYHDKYSNELIIGMNMQAEEDDATAKSKRWSNNLTKPAGQELKDSLDPGSDFLIELEQILTNTKPISDAPCLRFRGKQEMG